MQAGRLRHRVAIERKGQPEQDKDTGEVTDVWVEIFKTWASFEPISAKELIESGTLRNDHTARVIMRYKEITEEDRLIFNNQSYNITAIIPDFKSNREYLTLTVARGLKNE